MQSLWNHVQLRRSQSRSQRIIPDLFSCPCERHSSHSPLPSIGHPLVLQLITIDVTFIADESIVCRIAAEHLSHTLLCLRGTTRTWFSPRTCALDAVSQADWFPNYPKYSIFTLNPQLVLAIDRNLGSIWLVKQAAR